MFLPTLMRWLGRAIPQRPDLKFIMYTRKGCGLCEEAWELLESYRRQHGFHLEAVDVDDSAELKAQYGECVPVVTVNGKLRFRGRVSPVLLERLLRGE